MNKFTGTKDVTGFESMTCGRCGGSGKHSYNMMDGDRCWGCGGSGAVHTKRGAAARAFMIALQTRPAGTLAVGEFVYETPVGRRGKFRKVLAIEEYREPGTIAVELPGVTMILSKDDLVRATKGDSATHIAAALAYQETLSPTGKPYKRQPKAEAAEVDA